MAEHGTGSRYRRGCRCTSCRQANTTRVRAQRDKRQAAGAEPPEHGVSGYKNYRCRCDTCVAANSERLRAYRTDPAQADRLRTNGRTYRATVQRTSLATAVRYGLQWTGPELEIADRDDLTTAQKAAMLGRSAAAVQEKRKRIRRGDPMPAWLAGRRSRT